MSIRAYFPSNQFSFILLAVALSAGLVYAADYITSAEPNSARLQTGSSETTVVGNWQDTLSALQGNSATIPELPSNEEVASLLDAAESDNLTSTIGRSLLINLSNANSQGLGSDIPTQESLVAQAAIRAAAENEPIYTYDDFQTIPPTSDSLHTYGNVVVEVIQAHPGARGNEALIALAYAVDYEDSSRLAPLDSISQAYRSLAAGLASVPVPETLMPLHLQVVNDFSGMADAAMDMKSVLTDPIRGLSGMQRYQSLSDEVRRLFISIAETLNTEGILFTKDEAGSAWSAFLASP